MEQTEVKIRLVLDSNAGEVTQDVRNELEQTEKQAKKSGSMLGSAMGAGAVVMGNIYTEVLHKVMELGKEAFSAPIEAFQDSAKQVKQLAGTLTMLDSGKYTFQELKKYAAGVKDELSEMSMKVGVADDVLVNTFDNIIERGGKSVEQAKELTEAMAYAGRAIPGGAEGLSEAFENVSMGIIKAKNPLVGMISATGMLKGNAKSVAKEMMKMTPTAQIELAEKAVARMAQKMKDVPMTMGEAKTSMATFANELLKTMGEPMTKGLSKVFLKARGALFEDNGEQTELAQELGKNAERAGNVLSKAFELGGEVMGGIAAGANEFGEEFSYIWNQAFDTSDAGMKTMVEHAHEFGQLIGEAGKGFGIAIGIAVVGLKNAMQEMLQEFSDVVRFAGTALGDDEMVKTGNVMARSANAGDLNRAQAQISSAKGNQHEGVEAYLAAAKSAHLDPEEIGETIRRALDQRLASERNVNQASGDASSHNAANYAREFAMAQDMNDAGAQEMIARFLGDSRDMAEAIAKMGPDMIRGGVTKFADVLDSIGNKEMADIIRKGSRPKLDVGKRDFIQNFNGPIQIKQDFRNEDPDRVATIFRRDMAREGARRTQSVMTGPFGFG